MARKGKSTEEIIAFLREAEVRLAQEETAGKIYRGAGISEQTVNRNFDPPWCPANRLRHVPAVAAQTPTLAAISLLLRPLAAASPIRTRSAIDCRAPCMRVSAVNARFPASSVQSLQLAPPPFPPLHQDRRECK